MAGRVEKHWPYPHYIVETPSLTPEEQELLEAVERVLRKEISVADVKFVHIPAEYQLLFRALREEVVQKIPPRVYMRIPSMEERKELLELLEQFFKKFPTNNASWLAKRVVNDVFGLGMLDDLLEDEMLEEIMVNGPDKNVLVYHRKYGVARTNIVFSAEEIVRLARRAATTTGKPFSQRNPILDTHLPDGSRLNAVLPPVADRGPIMTIRKFTRIPFTVPDLIRNGTMSAELAAFLWLAVEGMGLAQRNMIIAGGTGAGKTTTLNALLDFVPISERIITVEDTRELDLGERENWVALVTRREKDVEVDMDTLLRAALRMRPDRIIVGEVRGPEAETLFIAMDVGHQGTMGTLHANSAREVLLRLSSPPMNVPEDLLPLMHLVLVQHRIKTREGLIRRVTELAEVTRMEKKALVSHVFKMDPFTKRIRRTDVPSHTLESIADITGLSKKDVQRELQRREVVLRWAATHIKSRKDFRDLVNAYYIDPEGVMDVVRKGGV